MAASAGMAAWAERVSDGLSPAIEKLDTGKPASSAPLLQRFLSALILMPVVIAGIYVGGLYFAAMVVFAAIIMIFEWTRMVERRDFSAGFYALAIGATLALAAAAASAYAIAIFVCATTGLFAFFISKRGIAGLGFWPAMAAAYLIAPSIALIWLRTEVENARALTFLLFFVVWAADSGAFLFGKSIGGPKISHALSPSKTWAGIAGGIVGGGIVAAAAAQPLIGSSDPMFFLFFGGFLGAVSVMGDLAESALKRYFGLKDISSFIPGHGGALDRLDGMIFATMAMTGVLILDMMAEKLQG